MRISREAVMAVQGLWSPDKEHRERAKSEISLGGHAVEAELVRALTELVEDQRPRYATGREAEGEAILNVMLQGEIPFRDNLFELHNHIINRRLMLDIIDLLGRLKSEAAIPLLISILERRAMIMRSVYSSTEAVGPEMKALSRIGGPAVPALIVALGGARSTAEREEEDINIGWGPSSQPTEEGEVLLSSYPQTEEDLQEDIEETERRTHKIRLRVVMTLGRVRDRAALPALKRLSEELSKEGPAARRESLEPNVVGSVFDLRLERDAVLVNALSDAVRAIEAGYDHSETGPELAEAGPDHADKRELPPGIGGWAAVGPNNPWDD